MFHDPIAMRNMISLRNHRDASSPCQHGNPFKVGSRPHCWHLSAGEMHATSDMRMQRPQRAIRPVKGSDPAGARRTCLRTPDQTPAGTSAGSLMVFVHAFDHGHHQPIELLIGRLNVRIAEIHNRDFKIHEGAPCPSAAPRVKEPGPAAVIVVGRDQHLGGQLARVLGGQRRCQPKPISLATIGQGDHRFRD